MENPCEFASSKTARIARSGGEYYLMVQSTNAKKGGNADYSVEVNKKVNEKDGSKYTEFFTQGDNSDDWRDMSTNGASGHVGTFGFTPVKSTDSLSDWVGYGDSIDYKGFTVAAGTQLCFEVHATGASKFAVYELVSKTKKGETTYSLKTLQSFTLKETEKGSGDYLGATSFYTFEEGGTYYFSMESTNAKKGGSASYTVMVGMAVSVSDALTMPETASVASALAMPETDSSADSLAMPDSLSFGQYDTDVLAGTYLDSAADKLFGESGNGLLASL